MRMNRRDAINVHEHVLLGRLVGDGGWSDHLSPPYHGSPLLSLMNNKKRSKSS
jgi:hypothetical protein